jgi:hypothetical protein
LRECSLLAGGKNEQAAVQPAELRCWDQRLDPLKIKQAAQDALPST